MAITMNPVLMNASLPTAPGALSTDFRRAAGYAPGMADEHHLSQVAHDRLLAELTDLTTRGRIDIARKIEVAREMGDLSENGDYHAAKEEKGKMEGRIMHLERLLENVAILESAPTGSDTVVPGCIVSLVDEDDDEPERMLFGSIEERHDDIGVVSPGSPLGEVLLGCAVGDEVSFEAPGGELTVRVTGIEH